MIDKKKPGVQARQEINERHKDKYFLRPVQFCFFHFFLTVEESEMIDKKSHPVMRWLLP